MTSRKTPPAQTPSSEADQGLAQEVLSHLNFSSGKRDVAFLGKLNTLWANLPAEQPLAEALRISLLASLQTLKGTSPVFNDCTQVEQVLDLALTKLPAAYREHHRDLLFHLQDADFEHVFLIGAFLEAVLLQGGPWDEVDRVMSGALQVLNDFVGYRPIAILENGRKMEVYDHERLRPVPVFIQGAGVAHGTYHDVVAHTLEFLKAAPADLLRESHFELCEVEELTLDMRAHDHMHPVNKRTNYMFGEWDPHHIDVKGNYRRFVIRKIIMDSLVAWVEESDSKATRDERLFDASAALCGTMLMASSISGSGPNTHDSSVTLTTLLPIVARRRDEFYNRLMKQVTGPRLKRLQKEQERTQQPFGHVRQFLNMKLAGYGAMQLQHRELAYLYAELGQPAAAQRQALAIPASSIRFECELECRIHTAQLSLNRGELAPAAEAISQCEGLLQRGIQCGAIVDPWNILGFQGQFPLFNNREDTIPDNRVETLIDVMEGVFSTYSKTIGEAAAQGQGAIREKLVAESKRIAEWWDKFASHVIDDLPTVSGSETLTSAQQVATALAEWRAGGEAVGDISFWRQHVGEFESAQAYALIVDALLHKKDYVAAMGLLMQWLSQIEQVGVESARHSIYSSLIRWMKLVADPGFVATKGIDRAALTRRLFAYLEANAEEFWNVPRLDGSVKRAQEKQRQQDDESRPVDGDEQSGGDEDNVLGAAYEGVTYKDSTDDGNWGNTLDGDKGFHNTEFELINREMEPRLKFLNAVAQLWQMSAVMLASDAFGGAGAKRLDEATAAAAGDWLNQALRWQIDLAELMESVWDHEVAQPSGDHDANVEYDIQLQVKFYLLHQIISTLICLRNAERLLGGCLDELPKPAGMPDLPLKNDKNDSSVLSDTFRAIVRRDPEAVRQLFPQLTGYLEKHPLLYVPLENGGEPMPILSSQTMQSVVRFLLRELPRLGLLAETWQTLETALKMERKWRPQGQAITEFDRLFDIALRNCLESAVKSVQHWSGDQFDTEALIDAVGEMAAPFQALWQEHAATMRISAVDGLRQDEEWQVLGEFITDYGADLFHASQLTLGNVRAILHNGVDWYIDYLEEEQDPLKPMRLLEDLDEGILPREDAEWCLEQIYSIVVDKFDRFLEYNTTTTQSDYGEMFHCLLEFLRVEARYDRDAWNMQPVQLVHEMLARGGFDEAARLWEQTYETETRETAERHLQDLAKLQKQFGMRMPTVTDHLQEKFVKPLAVNRMLALVKPAAQETRQGQLNSPSFHRLETEVNDYLEDSWGSGVDIPAWLRNLSREVADITDPEEGGRPAAEAELEMPPVMITQADFDQQKQSWKILVDQRARRATQKKAARKGKKKRKGDTE